MVPFLWLRIYVQWRLADGSSSVRSCLLVSEMTSRGGQRVREVTPSQAKLATFPVHCLLQSGKLDTGGQSACWVQSMQHWQPGL